MYALKVRGEVVFKSKNLAEIWKKFDELFLKGVEQSDMKIFLNYKEDTTK